VRTHLRHLIRAGRAAEAQAVLESSAYRNVRSAEFLAIRIQISIRLKCLGDARRIFGDVLSTAPALDDLDCLFAFAAALYEGSALRNVWAQLLDLSNAATDQGRNGVTDSLVLSARIRLALDDTDGFLTTLRSIDADENLGPLDLLLRAAAAAIAAPGIPDRDRPKIFGIGLARTGSTTLTAALTELGLSTIHWRNPLTHKLISDCDFTLFDGFTDTTVGVRFDELYFRFPNSKFVYTSRPLESWLTSIGQHWQREHGSSDFDEIKMSMQEPDVYWYGQPFLDLHNTLYFRYENFADSYRAHDQRVRHFFEDKPSNRFLEFDVFSGDGWEKLRRFIGVPLPQISFPWKNQKPDDGQAGRIMASRRPFSCLSESE
jgi:hypothetical protein